MAEQPLAAWSRYANLAINPNPIGSASGQVPEPTIKVVHQLLLATDINTSAEAAQALRPLAGRFASLLFGMRGLDSGAAEELRAICARGITRL